MKVKLSHMTPYGWATTYSSIDFDDERLYKWIDTYNRNNVEWTVMEVSI